MPVSRRSLVSLAVLALLGVFVGIGLWYQSRETAPSQVKDAAAIEVTNGADRGAGSLREALFIAAAAKGPTVISVLVPRITLHTALPPLGNAHGVRLSAEAPNGEIDASALPDAAVLDVASANVSIEGLLIRNCKGPAILLRASQFRLESTIIQSCDVGVDVAENSSEVLLERNRFNNNRVGVRFAGSSGNTSVVKNEFKGHRDAGVWAVRGNPDPGGAPITIRENRFTAERIGVLAVNVGVVVERNDLFDSREAAVQLMGPGAVVRNNRISGGASMGVVAENSRGAVIRDNEFDGLKAYGIMLKGSADALVQGNRVHNSGYGLAFVLGSSPSTAINNTIIEPRFNGIDVIGDSPVLRDNTVVRPRTLALKVVDFEAPGRNTVRSQPFLEGNNFNAKGLVIADARAAAKEGRSQ